jgi:hypothetical protein
VTLVGPASAENAFRRTSACRWATFVLHARAGGTNARAKAFQSQEADPIAGVDEIDDEAIEDVANRYEVSPLLVTTTLVNRGFLPRDALGNR